jgi:hypothetical protein
MKRKAKRSNKRDVSYNEDRNAAAPKTTGDAISERNNNTNASEPSGNEPNVERANETGLGDAGVNREKLTKYRSNRSMDA